MANFSSIRPIKDGASNFFDRRSPNYVDGQGLVFQLQTNAGNRVRRRIPWRHTLDGMRCRCGLVHVDETLLMVGREWEGEL